MNIATLEKSLKYLFKMQIKVIIYVFLDKLINKKPEYIRLPVQVIDILISATIFIY